MAAFVVGLLTLPFLASGGSWSFFAYYAFLLGIFPLIPSVFGPVVLLHGLLFLRAGRRGLRSLWRGGAQAASLGLVAIGTVALTVAVGQLSGAFVLLPAQGFLTGPYWGLAGTTSFPYGVLAVSWWRGSRP